MHVSRIQGKAGGWRQGQDLGLWQRNRVCCSFWQWVTRAPGCAELFLYLSPSLPPCQKNEKRHNPAPHFQSIQDMAHSRISSSEDNGILRQPLKQGRVPLLTPKEDLHTPGHHPLSLHINWKDPCASAEKCPEGRGHQAPALQSPRTHHPKMRFWRVPSCPSQAPIQLFLWWCHPLLTTTLPAFPVCSETFQPPSSNLHECVQIAVPLSQYVRSLWG